MTDFTKIKSKFVKQKINGLDYNKKNRDYLNDLLMIEKYNQGKCFGLANGYMIHEIKHKYPKEWDIIGKELDLNHITLEKEKELMEKEYRETEKYLAKCNAQEEKESKESWKKAGGKI